MPPPRRPAFILIAAASLVANEARAELPPLGSEAIREAVTGATVHLDTPLGTVLPLHFREDGSITGTAGSLAFYLGSASDRGRWWVAGGRLCWRWSRWFDGEQSCMQIRRKGTRVEWSRDDGKSGTATIVHKPAPSPPFPPVTVASVSPPTPPTRSAYALGGAIPREVEPAPMGARPPRPQLASPRRSPPAPTPIDAPRVKSEPTRKPEPTATRPVPTPIPATRPEQRLGQPPPAAPAVRTIPRPEQPTLARASTATPGAVQPSAPMPLPLPARPAASTAALPAAYRVVGVPDSDVLNIRTHPFHAAPIVSVIPPNGRGVHRLGPCQGVWCLVRWQSRTGWVNAIYLEADATRATVPGTQLVR